MEKHLSTITIFREEVVFKSDIVENSSRNSEVNLEINVNDSNSVRISDQ